MESHGFAARLRGIARPVAFAALAAALSVARPRSSAADPSTPPRKAAPVAEPPTEPFIPEEPATGRAIVPARPRLDAAAPRRACAFERAVCVHGAPSVSGAALAAVLSAAEAALGAYAALGLPTPVADVGGGGPEFDLYIVPGEQPAVVPELVASTDTTDRASAFAILPASSAALEGCRTRALVAYAVAHATLLGLDAGVEAAALAPTASYLAHLAAPCTPLEMEAVDTFQRAPELGLTAAALGAPDGSMLFAAFLDEAYGTPWIGAVPTALVAIAAQRTPPGAWWWQNEPDVFDALRTTMKDRNGSLDDLLLDFAVARAFVGSRADGAHLPDFEGVGDFGRVRFEWSIPFATLPRRLAPLRPIAPTGSTYLWIDLHDAPPDAELTLVADWELGAVFRWALVKIDRQGMASGRIDLATIYGSTHIERTLVARDVAGLLVVGTNVGSLDRSHPFDPDEQHAPHGYTLTVFK